MSKFLKFIVHFVIVCTIILVLALAIPPFFGITTVIVDSSEEATNLPLGSVTYAIPTRTEDLAPGAPILVEDEGKTYRYNFMSIDTENNIGTVTDPNSSNLEYIVVSIKNWAPRVVVTVGLIGYLLVATESIEGLIVLGLVILFLIILYVIAELCRKDKETLDEYEDFRGDRRHVKTKKELKMEEKAREKRMQQEDRELLYGEKARIKQAKKEEKERRKKIRTGGFVDEIYEDDLDEGADDVQRVRRRPSGGQENVQAATSEAHELLKKEIAAATAEEAAAEAPDNMTEELPSFRELQAERHRMQQEEEDWEEEEPVEIKKMAMPMWSAAQLAEKARRAGDTPDIVRDSITKVTLFDYSDIIGTDDEEIEE